MAETDAITEIAADVAGYRATLTFRDRDAVRAFFDEAKRQQGFLLPLGERPRPFASFAFKAVAEGGFELAFQARVVQISEYGGALSVAFLLVDWGELKDLELARKLAAREAPSADESENLGTSPVFRIKQMDPAAKLRLAMKADRVERQILCRDSSPQILLGLLSNPRLEAEDVLAIVRSTSANAAILERVAGERRWMSSAEIRTAVVRNPKTPTPLAVRLLDTLPITELRDMAKMGALREDVRRAAFRVYERLSGRR